MLGAAEGVAPDGKRPSLTTRRCNRVPPSAAGQGT